MDQGNYKIPPSANKFVLIDPDKMSELDLSMREKMSEPSERENPLR
jgi:hypothetical protein